MYYYDHICVVYISLLTERPSWSKIQKVGTKNIVNVWNLRKSGKGSGSTYYFKGFTLYWFFNQLWSNFMATWFEYYNISFGLLLIYSIHCTDSRSLIRTPIEMARLEFAENHWLRMTRSVDFGPGHLIIHPSKIPFKAPFKNRFFGIRTRYPFLRTTRLWVPRSEDKGT